ncbi:MAG: hypothetical protein NVSMB12_00060 [Acidimicrobiales bacterium]
MGPPPPRAPGSVRRTSHVDILWLPAPGVVADAETALVLRAAAQDVATEWDGSIRLLDRAELTVWLDRSLVTRHLTADPPLPLDALVGRPAAKGFRAAARDVVGAGLSLVGLLLDDVPVAALISGYAAMRSRGGAVLGRREATVLAMRDLCAGWRDGGTMMASIDRGHGVPTPGLGATPDIDRPDDPASGDPGLPLPPGSLRRRRRLDVLAELPDGATPVDATFRDTFAGPDGAEGTLHEYALRARLDPTGHIASIDADPRVLPWPECPAAAAGVAALVGAGLGEVPRLLPTGTSSCTHLNDLLRSLSGVAPLLALRPASTMNGANARGAR